MMRSVIVALAALLVVPASAQEDIWTESALPDGSALYGCGEFCEPEELSCVRQILPDSKETTVRGVITSDIWQEVDAAFVAEAAEQFPHFQIYGGQRVGAPGIADFGGEELLVAYYSMSTMDDADVASTVLMWPTKSGLEMLRCTTYVTEDADGLLQGLVIKLLDGN